MAKKKITVKSSFGSSFLIICDEIEGESFLNWTQLFQRGNVLDNNTILCTNPNDLRACKTCAVFRNLEVHDIF